MDESQPQPTKHLTISIKLIETWTGKILYTGRYYHTPDDRIPPSFFALLRDLTEVMEGGLLPVAPPPVIQSSASPDSTPLFPESSEKEKKTRKERSGPKKPYLGISWHYKLVKQCKTADAFREKFRYAFQKGKDIPDAELDKFWWANHRSDLSESPPTPDNPALIPGECKTTVGPVPTTTTNPSFTERTTRNGLKPGDRVRLKSGKNPQGVRTGTIERIMPGLREVKVKWGNGPASIVPADNLLPVTTPEGES